MTAGVDKVGSAAGRLTGNRSHASVAVRRSLDGSFGLGSSLVQPSPIARKGSDGVSSLGGGIVGSAGRDESGIGRVLATEFSAGSELSLMVKPKT